MCKYVWIPVQRLTPRAFFGPQHLYCVFAKSSQYHIEFTHSVGYSEASCIFSGVTRFINVTLRGCHALSSYLVHLELVTPELALITSNSIKSRVKSMTAILVACIYLLSSPYHQQTSLPLNFEISGVHSFRFFRNFHSNIMYYVVEIRSTCRLYKTCSFSSPQRYSNYMEFIKILKKNSCSTNPREEKHGEKLGQSLTTRRISTCT